MFEYSTILNRYAIIFVSIYFFIISFSLQNQDFPNDCDEFYNSSCFTYFMEHQGMNWHDANSDCMSRGGYLTSIHSEVENNLTAQLVTRFAKKSSNAWIGLEYTNYDQRSNWTDGTPVTYTNTLENTIGTSHCLVIFGSGRWRSFDCINTRHYICRQHVVLFGKLDENMNYQAIGNNEKLIAEDITTLICRTDTYPSSTEIIWEYKSLEETDWATIQEGNWNASTGISTVTIERGDGYYRCHVKIGGVEETYTANVTDPSGVLTTKSISTTSTTQSISTTSTTQSIPTASTTQIQMQTPSTTTSINTTANSTSLPISDTGSMIYIIVGASVVGGLVLIIILILILIIIIIIIKRRKPKAYEYLSKVKYSNSLSLALRPTVPTTKKEGRLTYQNLKDLTAGIEISEKELMDALEDPTLEMPNETDYVNVSDLRHVPASIYEEIDENSDPRMKPIQLDVYKAYLKKLWKKEGTLEEEYKSLGGVSLRYPCENALLEQNKAKNKYKMIYPYDKSRILLTPFKDDPTTTYINASYIPGVYTGQNFIAAQGPMERTIEDFWRLIEENNIENIVMLTNIIEGNRKKCEMYFPFDGTRSEKFGEYKIQLTKAELFPGYIIRHLKVEKGQNSFHVNQYHFTAWPDHDVPLVFDEFLSFVRKAYEGIKLSKSSLLVHCSAGVGRSGTFITIYNIMAAIERSKPISIYKVVHQMREHRPQMVQTFRQYTFIYLAVSEMLFQDTAIEAKEFTTTFEQYKQTDVDGYESFLIQQFNELNFQTENSFRLPSETGNDKENEGKNPPNSVIPYDENRVMLVPVNGGNDYINASYMMNLSFIATVHPKPNTLADFLQMIYHTGSTLVIMLATRKEKGEIEGRMSKRASYWGKTDESVTIRPFTVTNTHSEKSTTMIKQTLTITNNMDGFSSSINQIISLAWNDKGEPNDLTSVIVLIQTMLKYKQENPNLPIIVHCSDGIGRTGILLTTYKVIEDINSKDFIDIFHTIKHLRNDRMKFVPSLAHFLSCFELTNEYLPTRI